MTAFAVVTALSAAIVAGWLIGTIAERVPLPTLVQSMLAAFTGVIGGALVAIVVWFLWPFESGFLGAISVGRDSVVALAGVCLAAAAVHLLLGRFDRSWPAGAKHRALVLAIVAALCGAVPVIAAMMSAVGPPTE